MPAIKSLPATVRVPSSTRRPDGSVTEISFPISIGVISTVIVTALGATFSVDAAIGVVATNVFATAGDAKMKVSPITPIAATNRFNFLPTLAQLADSIRLYRLTSLDWYTSPIGCDLRKE